MINGIIVFQEGGIQQIGELTTLSNIIATLKQVLPDLENKERERILQTLSKEELEAALHRMEKK